MFRKRNRTRILSFLFIIILTCIISGCATVYYFETNQEKYKDYLLKKVPQGSHGIQFCNNKNWSDPNFAPENSLIFPCDSSETWINVEFLSDSDIPVDKEIAELVGSNKYLYSKIEFHPKLNIRGISVEHVYNGVKLKAIGSLIMLFDSKTNSSEIKYYSDRLLNTDSEFTFIKVYEYPLSRLERMLIKKKFWFPKKMIENISIIYEVDGKIETKNFQFEIKWNSVSFWIT